MADLPASSSLILNPYDIGVFAVLLLSVVFGVFRGFTREILSVGGWLSALVGTFYGYQVSHELVREWVGNVFFGDVITVVVIFVTLLVFFTLIIRTISDKVKGSMLGGLDRALGLLFGFLRGGVLIVGAFFASLLIWKTPDMRPENFRQARSLPYIIRGAEAAVVLLPHKMIPQKLIDNFGGEQEKTAEDLMKSLSRPKPKGKEESSESDISDDYKDSTRKEMSRLFKNFSHLEKDGLVSFS
tara:strand:- start:568 stop:1293 length:726 start_codon:yes stop_codon:yes gene_type:complete